MRLLLVEDDEPFGRALKTGLTQSGYSVEWVKDGASAIEAVKANDFGAVALDLNLPDHFGFSVLKEIRRTNRVPVLIMTARDAIGDRIAGLDIGADDYLVKPFDLEEFFARLRAVIRRSLGQAQGAIHFSDLTLDTNARTLHKGDNWVRLTAKEFQILSLLMQRMGRIISRTEIESAVYGWDDEVESNTVEANIYTLRKKIGRDVITTIRGVGYVIQG
jgi:DNA-binding response OmpR family regulator